MQCEAWVLPPWVGTCWTTLVMASAGVPLDWNSVELSPTVNPSRNESFLMVVRSVTLERSLPTAFGSIDQNTMLPPAPTGATWKVTVEAPPLVVWTVTVIGCLTMCAARLVQIDFGNAQLSPIA